MYLSRLIIKNYRSIEELDLKFEKGKNVIVGRNNAGKSNVIRAIDLILGESLPTYDKNENVTDNDFYQGDTSKQIFIYCELTRDPGEELNYEEMYKCYGFKTCARIIGWDQSGNRPRPIKEPERIVLSPNSHLADGTFFIKLDRLLIKAEGEYECINTKRPQDNTLENEFGDKHCFAFAFKAEKNEQGKIKKSLRFLYKENSDHDWIMAFSTPIRNELLQSAIIPSFRDPQNQLRISNWGWYGKLLKKSIDVDNQRLINAFSELKDASEEIFSELEGRINDSKVKIAFPNTKVHFQFNPDTKQDIHKSALIYVDDGFKSQLQDKGAGIQSVIIIGLFDYYTRELAHVSSSLLAIEEPELYLHPHGRRVVSNRLDDFLDGGKNQVIITTHSSEFIDSAHEDLNVIVVKKDFSGRTHARNATFNTAEERRILLKTQNTEMFFADYVILVEGLADKYILEALAKSFGQKTSLLGENWFDDFNISVIAVGGKGEFSKYARKLREVGVPVLIIADFDFFRRCLSNLMTDLSFEQQIINKVNEVKGRLGSFGNYKRIDDIPDNHHDSICNLLNQLKLQDILILKKELEDYYTEQAKTDVLGIDGKEEKAVYIAWEVARTETGVDTYINHVDHEEALLFIGSKLIGITPEKLTDVINDEASATVELRDAVSTAP